MKRSVLIFSLFSLVLLTSCSSYEYCFDKSLSDANNLVNMNLLSSCPKDMNETNLDRDQAKTLLYKAANNHDNKTFLVSNLLLKENKDEKGYNLKQVNIINEYNSTYNHQIYKQTSFTYKKDDKVMLDGNEIETHYHSYKVNKQVYDFAYKIDNHYQIDDSFTYKDDFKEEHDAYKFSLDDDNLRIRGKLEVKASYLSSFNTFQADKILDVFTTATIKKCYQKNNDFIIYLAREYQDPTSGLIYVDYNQYKFIDNQYVESLFKNESRNFQTNQVISTTYTQEIVNYNPIQPEYKIHKFRKLKNEELENNKFYQQIK